MLFEHTSEIEPACTKSTNLYTQVRYNQLVETQLKPVERTTFYDLGYKKTAVEAKVPYEIPVRKKRETLEIARVIYNQLIEPTSQIEPAQKIERKWLGYCQKIGQDEIV